ncbi:hypothetical protein RBU49_09770 [Clostridium sp. MB40-C1]|uniref:hypothetical protein n=1 Tax=Clostridium sp. MB40-C1 TaxID=3070996 RepID=UPI0027DF63D6|nr:hypothetical protein [Clostridium sp. MB40-C1]WMJ79177.1 hypothetical protein RBU49_09770 [Clostridium sp. MB40-C1]
MTKKIIAKILVISMMFSVCSFKSNVKAEEILKTKKYTKKADILDTIQETIDGKVITLYKKGEPREKTEEHSKDISIYRGDGKVTYYAAWQGTDNAGRLLAPSQSQVWLDGNGYKFEGLHYYTMKYVNYKEDGSDYLNPNFTDKTRTSGKSFPVKEGGIAYIGQKWFDPIFYVGSDEEGYIDFNEGKGFGIKYLGDNKFTIGFQDAWASYNKRLDYGAIKPFTTGTHKKSDIGNKSVWLQEGPRSLYPTGFYQNELFHYVGTFKKIVEYEQDYSADAPHKIDEGEGGDILFDPNKTPTWTNKGKISEGKGSFPVKVWFNGKDPQTLKGEGEYDYTKKTIKSMV